MSSVETINTVDIIPSDYKRQEAIGYEAALVSNLDLFNMMPYDQKNKISFHERSEISRLLQEGKKHDLLFIDGNHTDFNVIYEDFEICRLLSNEKSVFIWDDYYPEKFAIKDVIHKIAERHDYEFLLVESRGHLFKDHRSPEKNCGMVIMRKKGAHEDIFA